MKYLKMFEEFKPDRAILDANDCKFKENIQHYIEYYHIDPILMNVWNYIQSNFDTTPDRIELNDSKNGFNNFSIDYRIDNSNDDYYLINIDSEYVYKYYINKVKSYISRLVSKEKVNFRNIFNVFEIKE